MKELRVNTNAANITSLSYHVCNVPEAGWGAGGRGGGRPAAAAAAAAGHDGRHQEGGAEVSDLPQPRQVPAGPAQPRRRVRQDLQTQEQEDAARAREARRQRGQVIDTNIFPVLCLLSLAQNCLLFVWSTALVMLCAEIVAKTYSTLGKKPTLSTCCEECTILYLVSGDSAAVDILYLSPVEKILEKWLPQRRKTAQQS